MKPLFSSEKVRAMDARLIAAGTPGLDLMERAGHGVTDFILKQDSHNSVLILSGSGNNGGDGFVVARMLDECGWYVVVLLSSSPERSKGDAGANLKRLHGIPVRESSKLTDDEIISLMNRCCVVVDALLGTGVTGEPRGETLRLIKLLNATCHGSQVLAVDMPSGLEGGGTCVKAEWTCTIGGRKLALTTGRGAAMSGTVSFISLGEGTEKVLEEPDAFELEKHDIVKLLPVRQGDDHKGSRGGVLIVAGSRRYRGAALLAARGALRTGAGLVVLASCREVLDAATVSLPEVIAEPLETGAEIPDVMSRWSRRCSALLIGSGLDRDERARDICRAASEWQGRSLWDGDGLYWLAAEGLKPKNCSITPHEGEAAVLLGEKVTDRFEAVRRLASLYGSAVLKGYRSLVMGAGVEAPLVVASGDRTLSIPGSGDVLAGVASAFLASGMDGSSALSLAAWVHGTAGERLGHTKGQDGVLAREVADELPFVLKELYSKC